jgi:hypothetical protein
MKFDVDSCLSNLVNRYSVGVYDTEVIRLFELHDSDDDLISLIHAGIRYCSLETIKELSPVFFIDTASDMIRAITISENRIGRLTDRNRDIRNYIFRKTLDYSAVSSPQLEKYESELEKFEKTYLRS